MKYIKIHWIHNFKDDPEYIYSEVNNKGHEVRKIEIFSDGHHIVYSKFVNSDRLVEGKYPSLIDLNFEDDKESMSTIEITETEFNEIWNKYVTHA